MFLDLDGLALSRDSVLRWGRQQLQVGSGVCLIIFEMPCFKRSIHMHGVTAAATEPSRW